MLQETVYAQHGVQSIASHHHTPHSDTTATTADTSTNSSVKSTLDDFAATVSPLTSMSVDSAPVTMGRKAQVDVPVESVKHAPVSASMTAAAVKDVEAVTEKKLPVAATAPADRQEAEAEDPNSLENIMEELVRNIFFSTGT